MVEYDPYFKDKVKGIMRAEFMMKDGEPGFFEHDGRRNYRVGLQLVSDNPEIRKVDYKLHPTYSNPYLQSTDAKSKFAIEVTTYGDYYFVVEVIVGSELARQELSLFALLEQAYPEPRSMKVQEALDYIRTH